MLAAILAVAAVTDVRQRRVPLWLTVGGTIAGLVAAASVDEKVLELSLLGLAIGQLLLLPFILRGGFGAGDAMILGTVGTWMGWQFVMWTAWWGALVGACIALVALRRGRKSVPYVPAIALGAALTFVVSSQLV